MNDALTIICGDALTELRNLPDESVHCVCTSPPYWSLRDYSCNGQLGLEKTPEEYVAKMVEVFREVRRVLRRDGTLWLNLGSSYAGGGQGGGGSMANDVAAWRPGCGRADGVVDAEARRNRNGCGVVDGFKPKDLVPIPWMVAFALQQPYYTGKIKRLEDRTWLAALFDAEGCFGIRRQSASGNRNGAWNDSFIPYCSVKMSDRAALDKAVAITGFGDVRCESWRVGLDKREVRTRRIPYVWRLDGNKVVELARELYPHLLIKSPQAACICFLDKSNKDKRRGRGNIVPESVIKERENIWATIKGFNQRKIEILPKWITPPESLFEDGWWLRSDIIWAKKNPMPESVTDRPTKSHEYLFLLTKSASYFYDAEAIKEKSLWAEDPRADQGHIDYNGKRNGTDGQGQRAFCSIDSSGRNKRSVWTVATAPYPEAHFATYPPDLIKPCIMAGTSAKGCCANCGAPWERTFERVSEKQYEYQPIGIVGESSQRGRRTESMGNSQYEANGWQPTCRCDAAVVPCTVLDPFAGSGTTGAVALELGRKAVLIELNPKYVALIEQRCDVTLGLALA